MTAEGLVEGSPGVARRRVPAGGRRFVIDVARLDGAGWASAAKGSQLLGSIVGGHVVECGCEKNE